MIKNCDRSADAASNKSQAEPDPGSAFLLSQTQEPHSGVDLAAQSQRAIELFQAALDKGNMTAAASALKHLSDLHGLGKGDRTTPEAGELSGYTDAELDALIQSLTT